VAFNFALGVSVMMLALCLLGFGGKIGLLIRRTGPTATSPYCEHTVAFDRGRFTIWTETWPAPSQPGQVGHGVAIRPLARFRLRFPKIDGHAFGGFDAHPLRVSGASGSTSLYLIACPIWALALPFLIAPTIWLRRWHIERRRKREQQGFPVTSIAPEPQPQ
jgi:hypothetical protein